MLVLSRKEDQTIIFPNLGISIEIVRVQGNKVSVGVEAPKTIRVVRGELQKSADDPQAATSDVSLGKLIELLAPAAQLELRACLDTAGLAVYAAQKQCEIGGNENAEFFLSKAVDALAQLNKMFESPQPTDSSTCVNEAPAIYGLATSDVCLSSRDRGVSDWFSKPSVPHQLVEYLQQQLCSHN